ncbi:MAG: penicillin-binding protein activator [Desulfobacteraceae bacterium]|nr:penicillin-binding protein activator [Desulfobacteraceae bacterium]
MENKKSNYRFRLQFIIVVILLFLISSCAEMQVSPTEQQDVPAAETKPSDDKIQKHKRLYEVLLKEALEFSIQNNNKDALLLYNQALTFAPENEVPVLMGKIESILVRTDPAIIEAFLENENIKIPTPLLLYWLGLNHASNKAYPKSKTILTNYILKYPDHRYVDDAKELLMLIKTTLFKSDTIGCLLPLSGKYALFGKRALMGVQMAIHDLSKQHGKKFNAVIKDTQSNTTRAVECVNELNQKKVAAILGPLLTVKEAGKQAQKLGIPMVALTQKSEFPAMGEYLFSNFITPQMQVQTLAAYAFIELGIEKVAILYPNERYGKKYMNLFWDVVEEFDGKVVGVESYDGKKTDFTKPIQKLTGEYYPVPGFLKPKPIDMDPDQLFADPAYNPDLITAREAVVKKDERIKIDFDALFIPDSPSKINLILPQLVYNDAKGMYLLGTNLWHHKSLLIQSKGYNRKAVITDGFFKESKRPATAQFASQFKEVFQSEPGFIEAIAYDTASILLSVAMDEAVNSRNKLKDALRGRRVFEGVTGNTIFDKEGNAHKELFLMTIKKNKFVEISR